MTDDFKPVSDDDPGEPDGAAGERPLDDAEILARLEESLTADLSPEVNPVDECMHDWFDIGFVPSGGGLICGACGESWYLDDPDGVSEALLVVWNAAKSAVEETQHRVGALEQFISDRLGAHRCEACNTWSDDLIEVDDVHACRSHLGDVVADCDPGSHPEAFDAIIAYVDASGIADATDLESVVQWERLVTASEAIAAVLGDTDDDAALTRVIDLHPLLADRLELAEQVRVGELANRLATLLETDTPTSRLGVSFLLSLLWCSIAAVDAPTIEAAAEDVVDRAVPVYEANRMTVAVDLCGHGMPDGTTFMASLANQALSMVARRAALQLLTLFHQPAA